MVNGDGGDIIHLVELTQGLEPKPAAEWIIREQGGEVDEPPKRAKKPRPEYAPAPADCSPTLSRISTPPDLVTKYRNADGSVVFAVLRWNAGTLEAEKAIRPIYPTTSGTWAEGLPEHVKKCRPLLGLPRLGKPAPLLVVEGEKNATDALRVVKSRIVTSWHGGADNAQHVDAELVATWPDVVMWPDHDEPGRKAAFALKAKIPALAILDVWTLNRPDGWDISDAIAEGMDVEEFIATCPRLEAPDEETAEPAPFRAIGYDAGSYWFLLGSQRQPYTISKGNFNSSKLGELAPPSWWAAHKAINDNGGIDVTCGQQIVIDMENRAGLFRPDILRGSGVWLDRGEIIISEGERIVRSDGTTTDLASYDGEAVYVRSSVRFGDMTGAEATAEEGQALGDLFSAQGWSREVDSIAALGWSLIAPFGGILKFRPHIWVTGRKGSGKTFVLENLIAALCGPFAHQGSGKDTEAGIRRTLNMDARPVILDEMEPKTKIARDNVSRILELERNASSDGSGRVTMAAGAQGTAQFLIRSCFCNASINPMMDDSAAIASRIIVCELLAPKDKAEERRKIQRSIGLYAEAMRDPARYRRRIFRALPRILRDVEILHSRLQDALGAMRDANLWAPLLAAAWAVQSDESLDSDEGRDWLARVLDEEAMTRQSVQEDEDRVIEHLLQANIDNDDHGRRTIAELLERATAPDGETYKAGDILERHGIRVIESEGRRVLAIACRWDALAVILRDTPYSVGYDSQLKRHPLCLTPDKPKRTRFSGSVVAARHLDWFEFHELYMREATT